MLARVGEAADPDSAYLAGRAWAGKAESAPVPTPVPGAPAAAARLKPEEERALAAYERAVAARPDFVDAQLAIAELLAPHALAAVAARAAADAPGRPCRPPDPLVARVLRSYGNALQADLAGTKAAEGLIDFATRAGRPGEADAAFQELVRRRREDPALLVRYGDFLAGPGGKPEAALAQYAQALIWKPDDDATKLKMADIHLAAAAAHLRDLQYVAAEARLKDARRYTVDPASPQAARLAELEAACAKFARPLVRRGGLGVGDTPQKASVRAAADPVVVDVDEAALLRRPRRVVLGDDLAAHDQARGRDAARRRGLQVRVVDAHVVGEVVGRPVHRHVLHDALPEVRPEAGVEQHLVALVARAPRLHPAAEEHHPRVAGVRRCSGSPRAGDTRS